MVHNAILAGVDLECVHITIEWKARSVIAGSDPCKLQMDIHVRPSKNSGILCSVEYYRLLCIAPNMSSYCKQLIKFLTFHSPFTTLSFSRIWFRDYPLWGAFAIYLGNFYCTFTHSCTPDLMKEIAPVVGNWIIALFKSLLCPISYQPGRVGHNSDSRILYKHILITYLHSHHSTWAGVGSPHWWWIQSLINLWAFSYSLQPSIAAKAELLPLWLLVIIIYKGLILYRYCMLIHVYL